MTVHNQIICCTSVQFAEDFVGEYASFKGEIGEVLLPPFPHIFLLFLFLSCFVLLAGRGTSEAKSEWCSRRLLLPVPYNAQA